MIASGFGEQADKDVFIIGPTGLALGRGRRALCLRRDRQPHRRDPRRRDPHHQRRHRPGRDQGRPAAPAAGDGHGPERPSAGRPTRRTARCVEIDPATGKQLHALWIDANKAQSPPGSGDLFGIAMTPAGDGFYYVEDEMNTLVLAH